MVGGVLSDGEGVEGVDEGGVVEHRPVLGHGGGDRVVGSAALEVDFDDLASHGGSSAQVRR
jgi:hypothetical protein